MNVLAVVVMVLLLATLAFVMPPLLKGDPDGSAGGKGAAPRR